MRRLIWQLGIYFLLCTGIFLSQVGTSNAQSAPQCSSPPVNIWVNRVAHRPPGGDQYVHPDLETDYLVGVLEGEMAPISTISRWDDQALETGSVAIRTWSAYWCHKHTLTNMPYGTIQGLYDTSNPPYDDQEYHPGHGGDTLRYSQQITATQGIYLSYNGTLIDAQYRARNGDPTNPLENPYTRASYPYLRSVRDPVAAAESRSQSDGQSVGLAQNGSHYWASGHDPTPNDPLHPRWSHYEQILAHYYTRIHLRDGNGSQLTSAYRWNALQINNAPTQVPPGHTSYVSVWVQNTGTASWFGSGDPMAPSHALSYRIFDVHGNCVANCSSTNRAPLDDHDEKTPGDDLWRTLQVYFPPSLKGPVVVRLDMVQLITLVQNRAPGQEGKSTHIQPSATTATVDFWFADYGQGWYTQDIHVCVGGCAFLLLVGRQF